MVKFQSIKMEENKNNNSNFIENLLKIANSFFKPIVEIINNPKFKIFAEQFIFLSDNIEDRINLLDKYNWFIPDSISFIDFQKFIFLLLNENITQNQIDKAFLDFYFGNNFKELEFIINNLKENMEEERFLIIKDCFNVLKDNFENKNYNSSNLIIPTLLIHIDRYRLDVEKDYLKEKIGNLKIKKKLLKF